MFQCTKDSDHSSSIQKSNVFLEHTIGHARECSTLQIGFAGPALMS